MGHELATLFAAGFVYLLLLFLVAYATDRDWLPSHWAAHPLTYTLSIGVYATSWTYYGSVGYASVNGLLFLTIYIGATLAFVLSPVLLQPILRVSRDYQLTSLADLLAFRYRSQAAGVLVTLFMLLGTMPYIALQIRAVTESLQVLSNEVPSNTIALVFCATLILFGVLFGTRHISPREKHRGLVVAIAFESLIKLVVLLLIGGYALFGVFGGTRGLEDWLAANPQAIEALYRPVTESPWSALVFLSFAAAFLLPRQFHMLFAENLDARSLRTATWAMPAFLLLLNLSIPVILWAGRKLGLGINPDYFVLGITLADGPSWLSLLAFIGGLSAASAMVIVTSIALATMSLNHLLLPASYPDPAMNLYRWILWGRRLLIGLIIMAGYGFYVGLKHSQSLVELGLISFVAVAQFLPGIAGMLYWRRATRVGFVSGLLGGICVWSVLMLAPLLYSSGVLITDMGVPHIVALSGMHKWAFATFATLTVNGGLFVLVSMLTRQSPGELEAANACCAESTGPLAGVVAAGSPDEFRTLLAGTLGRETADGEVDQALADLGMRPNERRTTELRRLRERIERNLSGLLGPQLAHIIVNRRLELDPEAKTALADSMRYVEERLETSRSQLRGLSVELDNLRRLHRQILQDLPLGVCATDSQGKIVLWNLALEMMTGVDAAPLIGTRLDRLPPPWDGLLAGFSRTAEDHAYRTELAVAGRPRWYNLHKAAYADPVVEGALPSRPGMVMLIEDLTDLGTLEAELAHNDRLASVGRLAAGVAHEIGNPVTGIASLAQNLRHEDDPDVVRQSIEEIIGQTRRISDILRTLKGFSRGSRHLQQRETFALCEAVDDAVHLLRLTHKHDGIRFEASCPGDIVVTGNRQQLSQVLVNLLANAADASRTGDRVDLLVRAAGDEAIIEIMDQGQGIPEELRETIFEPFYTTKPTGQGTGLGLSLSYKIIEDHNGTLAIDSQVGLGTRVIVNLPLRAAESANESFAHH
ncbi:MAG: PAS domain S-box protein [Chromatiaceae bacterium]|nr:PAS domain S-box protein [Gammaproteobacteria bacterium]MCP5306726.1 PAS domain S-box protein [Chromatiaceae bacterium]MCP5421772.1 PAS domain S-box protein [Chromatiaceae bacterium]